MKQEEEEEEVVEVKKKEKEVAPTPSAAVVDDSGFTAVGKAGKAVEADERSVLVRLREVLESRGKKVIDAYIYTSILFYYYD